MDFNHSRCCFCVNHNHSNHCICLPEEVSKIIQIKKNFHRLTDFLIYALKNINILLYSISRYGIIVCQRTVSTNTIEKSSTSNPENNNTRRPFIVECGSNQMELPNTTVTGRESAYTYPRPQSDIYEEAPDSIIGRILNLDTLVQYKSDKCRNLPLFHIEADSQRSH